MTTLAVAQGGGIDSEIMDANLRILIAAGSKKIFQSEKIVLVPIISSTYTIFYLIHFFI